MIVDIPEIPVNISTSDTDAVEVVSVDLLIVWPFKFKGSPFNLSATILFLLTYFADDGFIKHFSMQNQLDESTYFQRINDLAFGDIRLIDENGLKIKIPKSSFLEIVLNEDVSFEFEEFNDIDLEAIYLDNLSISYDDGTENYADYFLKKDHYSISKLDIEGNGKGLYFIKSLALKLNGDHEQKEEFERLYKCKLDFLDQIQTINFSLLLGNKIIAEIETYDAYINTLPS